MKVSAFNSDILDFELDNDPEMKFYVRLNGKDVEIELVCMARYGHEPDVLEVHFVPKE